MASEQTDEDEYRWPISNMRMAQILGISESTIRQHQRNNINELVDGENEDFWSYRKRMPGTGWGKMTLWYERGAVKLAHYCRTREAGIFLDRLGIRERHVSFIESPSLAVICAAIEGFTRYARQHPVQRFKIDLYLIDWKIAVECDERAHQDNPVVLDYVRQKLIEGELGCRFVRFNPNEPDFNIGKVINEIFSLAFKRYQMVD